TISNRYALGLWGSAGARRGCCGGNHEERSLKEATNQNRAEFHVVRVAGRQTREIKCDRLRPGGSDPWHWRRADVAYRCFTHCNLEVERRRALAQRQRGRERRFLSIPGWADRRRGRRRDVRHSAGWIGP